MPKEWILNSAVNRFQFNFKKNVGSTSESIRKCSPNNIEEWQNYYFENVRSKEHIEELGRKLYIKITEIIQFEVDQITEQDCIDYLLKLVIDRTFDGYMTEIKTIYEQLKDVFHLPINAAPDEWDRLYNVDFYIQVGKKYIGIQIKPVNNSIQLAQIHKEYNLQKSTHKKFYDKYGGNVYYIFSEKKDNKKVIKNPEVIDEIKLEIKRIESIC